MRECRFTIVVKELFEEILFGLCAEIDGGNSSDDRVKIFSLLPFFICEIIQAYQKRTKLKTFDFNSQNLCNLEILQQSFPVIAFIQDVLHLWLKNPWDLCV